MSTSICQSNLTSGFIDLATYDELEKFMYGGADAIAYFVRETRKATWFTQVPVQLAKCEGVADFGQEWSVSISRSGDYLLGTWLHVALPAVSVAGYNGRSVCIAWTPNLMHALVKNCSISFNDLVAARFDGTHLDFWAAFTTPSAKAEGYRQMIGAQIPSCGGFIPAQTCDLPLPFFYTRDSGVALPTAALPYNEMRISFTFRPWDELIVGFAPKIDCYNYAITKAGQITGDNSENVPYVIPAFNSSATGIQPCWNSDIWPACVPPTDSSIVPTTYPDGVNPNTINLVDGTLSNNTQRLGYQNSQEMSFILLPKLPGPPTAYLSQSGQNQVTQTSDKTNFDIANAIPYYIGQPVNKKADGIFCDIKELSLDCQVWANYSIVSNEERKKMACAPRDILIEQVQQTPEVDFHIRNQPDSRWWPNNIPELTSGTNEWDVTATAPPDFAPVGSANSGSFAPSSQNNPDNEIPCGEVNWPQDNKLPQQPSKQGWCLNSNSQYEPSLQGNWTSGEETRRSLSCEDSSGPSVKMNLKYAYTVKALFFGVKNVTAQNIHSNYTIGFPVMQTAATDQVTLDGPVFSKNIWDQTIDNNWKAPGALAQPPALTPHYTPYNTGGIEKYVGKIQHLTQSVITCKNGFDPIERASMLYETTPRLGLLDSSYYSLTQPYYHAPAIPSSTGPVFCPTGYHMYSYSLEFMALDPLGSTNYGKLTNVALEAEPIKLNSSNLCPELSYAVPNINISATEVNTRYTLGPINAPGIAGADAQALKNQSVLEILINIAYQNIYTEWGLETISPWSASATGSLQTTQCSYLGKYKFVSTAINNNILRVSGGSVGFPVL